MAQTAALLWTRPLALAPAPEPPLTEVLGSASRSGVWVMITPRVQVSRLSGGGRHIVETRDAPGRPRGAGPQQRSQREPTRLTWPPSLPFEQVLQRARDLDQAAISLLYKRFLPVVYRYTMARISDIHTAEDVTSEAFFAMVEGISAARAVDELSFAAWLLGIARNKIAMHYRSMRSRPDTRHELADDAHPFATAEQADPLAVITARESWSEVVAALNLLTEEQRAVVLYRCILGYSTDEVAQLLEKQPGTIRALQFRALASLDRHLNAAPPPPRTLLGGLKPQASARREGRKGNASRR